MDRLVDTLERTGDLDWSLVRPDFEIHDVELLDSGVHRGRAGWKNWVADWRQAWEDYSVERLELIEVDQSRILTVHRLRARGRVSGVELERTDAQLWTFAEGLLARMEYLPDFRTEERSWALPGGARGTL
jgi:ketosteroid isomerase-like protein